MPRHGSNMSKTQKPGQKLFCSLFILAEFRLFKIVIQNNFLENALVLTRDV